MLRFYSTAGRWEAGLLTYAFSMHALWTHIFTHLAPGGLLDGVAGRFETPFSAGWQCCIIDPMTCIVCRIPPSFGIDVLPHTDDAPCIAVEDSCSQYGLVYGPSPVPTWTPGHLRGGNMCPKVSQGS